MKTLPFFIITLFICACNQQQHNYSNQKDSLAAIVPAVDTVISKKYKQRDPVADSLAQVHAQDSFYVLPVKRKVITANGIDAIDQLAYSIIDTSGLVKIRDTFTEKEFRKYDKAQLPLLAEVTYSSGNCTVKVISDLTYTIPKKIFINGKLLKHINIQDTLTDEDSFFSSIELDPATFSRFRFRGIDYLYMRGGIEKCNGNGCGLSFNIIYNFSTGKAVDINQYRIYRNFCYGSCAALKELCFLYFDDFAMNDYFGYFPQTAHAYSFGADGKIRKATNAAGNQYFFDGYSVDGEDVIFVREECMISK